jgi:hypothetical protein
MASLREARVKRRIPRVSSRLTQDSRGRLVVEITSSCDVGLVPGDRFLVIGNDFEVAAPGFRMLGTKTSHQRYALDVAQHGRPRLPDAAKRDAGTR